MNKKSRPLLGYMTSDILESTNKLSFENFSILIKYLFGEHSIDVIPIYELNNISVDLDIIVYCGKFNNSELRKIIQKSEINLIILSLSSEEKVKWFAYLDDYQHRCKVVWGPELRDTFINEINTSIIGIDNLNKHLGLFHLKKTIINLLEQKTSKNGLWLVPRFQIQKKIYTSLKNALNEIIIDVPQVPEHKLQNKDEFKLYRIKMGLTIFHPSSLKFIKRESISTGEQLYTLVVPLMISNKDAYSFLYSEFGRNYEKIVSYLTGIMHGLINSDIDINIASKFKLENNINTGFVCRLFVFPPHNEEVFTYLVKPKDVFIDIELSPELSEFDSSNKEQVLKVSTSFYKSCNLINDNFTVSHFINNLNLNDVNFRVNHLGKPDHIPIYLSELSCCLMCELDKNPSIALLFSNNGMLKNRLEPEFGDVTYEFNSDSVQKSIEKDALLSIFTKDEKLIKYSVVVSDPPSHHTIDFLLARLKVYNSKNDFLYLKYVPTGENVIQRIGRGSDIFITFGGSIAEPRTILFIKKILLVNFELVYELIIEDDIIFLCSSYIQSGLIDKTLLAFENNLKNILGMTKCAISYNSLTQTDFNSKNNKTSIIAISGPSGAGKDTLIKKVLKKYDNYFGLAHQYISRTLRDDELLNPQIHKIDKSFVFDSNNKLLAQSIFGNNVYAISEISIQEIISSGKSCLINVDPKGIKEIANYCNDKKIPFISVAVMAGKDILKKRIKARNTKITEEELSKRLDTCKQYNNLEQFSVVLWNETTEKDFIYEFEQYLWEQSFITNISSEELFKADSISYSKSASFIFFPLYTDEKDKLADYISKKVEFLNNISYLDIGAGAGEITTRLIKKLNIKKLTLVEPSNYNYNILEENVKYSSLTNNYPQKIKSYNDLWENVKINDTNKFNLITLIHVYLSEHDFEKSINKIKSVLNSNGLFIVIVHDNKSQYLLNQEKIYRILGGKFYAKFLENRNPTDKDYENSIKNAGFTIISNEVIKTSFNLAIPEKESDLFNIEFIKYSAAMKFYCGLYLDELANYNKLDEIRTLLLENTVIDDKGTFNISSLHKVFIVKTNN